jgi:hypothetical protein
MADMQKELTNYNRLGFARHLAATPGITPDKGREIGSKYQKQLDVRTAKFDRIAKTVRGD